MTGEATAPDGGEMVGPFDRAGWRAWLIANHGTSGGVHLVSWRKGTGRTSVAYEDAVEEALCVGWIDPRRSSTRHAVSGRRSSGLGSNPAELSGYGSLARPAGSRPAR